MLGASLGRLLYDNAASTAALCLFMATSVSITVVNKIILTTFGFHYPACMLASRMIFTVLGLEIMNRSCIINIPKYTLSRGKGFAFATIFFSISCILSLSALKDMNMAVYAVVKRCTPLITVMFSILLLKSALPSRIMLASIVTLTGGCIIAGIGDISFNMTAYAYGLLSNVAKALYLILVQQASTKNLSPLEAVHLNSVNCLPLSLLAFFFMGEAEEILDYPRFKEPLFIGLFLLDICLGCVLTYSTILCTSLTSAVTTSVVGGLKAFAQTAIGLVTFGGLSHNLSTYVGVFMSTAGVLGYIFSKYWEHSQRKTTKVWISSTMNDCKDSNNKQPSAELPLENNSCNIATA